MGPNNNFIHLCIAYPKYYNLLGGWNVINNAFKFIVKKAL